MLLVRHLSLSLSLSLSERSATVQPRRLVAGRCIEMEASAPIHRYLGFKTRPLSCTARFNHKYIIRSLPYKCRSPFRLSVCMRIGGSSMETPGSETKTTLSYTDDKLNPHIDHGTMKSDPAPEEQNGEKLGMDLEIHAEGVNKQKKAAKIHDFCFGIPFGGLVISGGLVGFLFSRNPETLISGVLFGGALLALSVYSLKVWRQGKSSVPFILGQAALAATLLGKHFQMFTLTKKLFPTGFYTFVSAFMLLFYSYVLISGGNPPPKKLKLGASPS